MGYDETRCAYADLAMSGLSEIECAQVGLPHPPVYDIDVSTARTDKYGHISSESAR